MERKTNRSYLIKVLALCVGLSVAPISQAQDWKKYIVPTVVTIGVAAVISAVLIKIVRTVQKSFVKKDEPVEINKDEEKEKTIEEQLQEEDSNGDGYGFFEDDEPEQKSVYDEQKKFREEVYKLIDKWEKENSDFKGKRLRLKLIKNQIRTAIFFSFLSSKKYDQSEVKEKKKEALDRIEEKQKELQEEEKKLQESEKQKQDFFEGLVEKIGFDELMEIFTSEKELIDIKRKNAKIRKQIEAAK